ncbi:inner centromere protein A [Copidosoma floridanum]|uniref:inner centromere protein A n=1 Tax=Copidosoma floridanum TaxID=29053 RepID=UPI0006C99A64|nr:inner centromere protein A [Copidosoma floridanum]
MLGRALLACALLGQVLGAPTDCTDYCGEQGTSYGGQARDSYGNSYASKSSSYEHRLQRVGGRSGNNQLQTSGRLENLDENAVVGSSGLGLNLDRPGSWQDEKHYVTDDGKGQMSYRAGQTVTGNGYSKFAEHSYSYGTHDSHARLANSQVLTTAEFNRELASMRNRIASFMGSFHVDAGSVVNANQIADFRDRAGAISNQLNDVCNQVDAGSSMYQQIREMQQQFDQDIDRMQKQMERQLEYHSSSSSQVYGSFKSYPSAGSSTSRPVAGSSYSQPIQQQQPVISEESIVKQRLVEDEIAKIQSQVSSFYTNFGRVDTNAQYKVDLGNQADVISRELANLKLQALQSEHQRARVDNLRSHFENYLSEIRDRIHKLEDRQREEAARQLEIRIQEEKNHYEENLRNLKLEKQRIEKEAEAERARREEELFRAQEEEAARKEAEAAAARLRQQQQQQQEEERRARLEVEEVQKTVPQSDSVQGIGAGVAGKVEVTGSSSYEHTINTWSNTGGRHSSGSFQSSIGGGQSKPIHQQQHHQLNAHVDLTAATSRLQQELHRIQNEINNFNTHSMRLTAANSQSVIGEAERQAESLRQSISNLCETSSRYQNQNIQSSAEELSQRFEDMVRSLERQAANYLANPSSAASGFSASAGYTSSSSYGSNGAYSAVQAPTITNVEYEHSKSAEVEVSRRPLSSASSQRYAQSSGQRRADCVEHYAGQPCVETRPQQQQRRYRRQAEAKDLYDPDFDWTQQQQQQQQPIFDANYQRSRNDNQKPFPAPEEEPKLSVGPKLGVLSFGPKSRNSETERQIENLAARIASYGQSDRPQRPVHRDRQQDDLAQRHVDTNEYRRPQSQESTMDHERQRQSRPSFYSGFNGDQSRGNDKRDEESLEHEEDESDEEFEEQTGASHDRNGSESPVTSEKPKNEEHALGSGGFYDSPSYVRSESYNRNVQSLGGNSGDGSLWTAGQQGGSKTETLDRDSVQQTAGRVNFGSDSQLGRRFSLQNTFGPQETNATHEALLLSTSDKRKEGGDRAVETGPPQSLEQPSHDVLEIFYDVPSADSANTKTENARREEAIDARPTLKGKADQGNGNGSQEKPSGPHRGDLPGHSEPSISLVVEKSPPVVMEKPLTTENPVFVTPKPLSTIVPEPIIPIVNEKAKINKDDCNHQMPVVSYNFKLSHEKSIVNLNGNDRLSDVQNSNNQWQQKTSDLDGLGQSSQAFFNHQKYHHNYYYNQFNNKYKFDDQQQVQQIWNPMRTLELSNPMRPAAEFSAQNKSTELSHLQESFNKFHGYQREFKVEKTGQNVQPIPYEESAQFLSGRQSNYRQEIQEPTFLPSSQWHDSLSLENSGQNSNSSLIMVDNLPPIKPWIETEPTSTQRTFWKRVGHKLSYSYNKAKERARTIFG